MDELLRVLRQHAADFADRTVPVSGWQVVINSVGTRITAATKQLAPTQAQAWENAERLRDLILDLGYEIGGESEIGVRSEIAAIAGVAATEGAEAAEGAEGIEPVSSWRGFLNIVVSTT